MKPLISIIIPVYNVENLLARCLDSVVANLTLQCEILLVDDGSTDKSGEICDEYASRYGLTVFHKPNGGLSDARNFALDRMKGSYVAFVDSDDFVEKDIFATLYQLSKSENAEIACCSFWECNGTTKTKVSAGNATQSNVQFLKSLAEKDGYKNVVMWNKLFDARLFDGVRFPVGRIHEDQAVIHLLAYKAKKIAFTDKAMYYHTNRGDNISTSSNFLRHFDDVQALLERAQFYRNNNLEELLPTVEKQMFALVSFYKKCARHRGGYGKEDVEKISRKLAICKQFCVQFFPLMTKRQQHKRNKLYTLSPLDRWQLLHFDKIRKSVFFRAFARIKNGKVPNGENQ